MSVKWFELPLFRFSETFLKKHEFYNTSVNPISKSPIFIAISACKTHKLGIDHNGDVWSIGYNESGQLGIGQKIIPELGSLWKIESHYFNNEKIIQISCLKFGHPFLFQGISCALSGKFIKSSFFKKMEIFINGV